MAKAGAAAARVSDRSSASNLPSGAWVSGIGLSSSKLELMDSDLGGYVRQKVLRLSDKSFLVLFFKKEHFLFFWPFLLALAQMVAGT